MRNRAPVFAVVALAWYVMAIATVSVALSCDEMPAMAHGEMSAHGGMAGHEGMADCPMQKKEPSCPLHGAQHGTHKCDCPTMGCSRTDTGFMALFGAVGVLPTVTLMYDLIASGDATPVMSASANHLGPAPISPPPRT